MSEGRIPLSGGSGSSGGTTPDPGQPSDGIPVGLPIGADLEPGGKATDDDGVLDFATDAATGAAGFAAEQANKAATSIFGVFWKFLKSGMVIFLPIPFPYLARKQLAWSKNKENELEFCPQQLLVSAAHVIWIGWLVGACTLYNHLTTNEERHLPDSVINGLEWAWIVAVCLTVLMMGLNFGRVALGFLIAAITVLVLGVLLYEQVGEVELVKQVADSLKKVDVELGWGVPIIVSGVLGLSLLISSTWQQLNDRWAVTQYGNFLEHENFAAKDVTIQKGAKTFIHSWPCLVKRLLIFGYGDIEVRDSRGQNVIAHIQGVIWASTVSTQLKKRFESTDVRDIRGLGAEIQAQAFLEEEEEEA